MSKDLFVENVGEIAIREEECFWILPHRYITRQDLDTYSPWFLDLGEKRSFVITTPPEFNGDTFLRLRRKFLCHPSNQEYTIEIRLNNFYQKVGFYYRKGVVSDYGFQVTLGSKQYVQSQLLIYYGLIKICFIIKRKCNSGAISLPTGTATSNKKNNKVDAIKEDETNSEDKITNDEENGIKENTLYKDKGINNFLENLRQFFLDGRMSDAVLKVDGREFKVHKLILAARSPVFASMFEHDLSEKKSNVVDIPDCSAESFEVFLLYLYSGSIETLSGDNVYNVHYAADKYRVDDLKEKCVEFMIKNISVETFCEVITLSFRHGESKLQKIATNYICKNMKNIIKTVQWQKYLDENSTQANELVIKAVNA